MDDEKAVLMKLKGVTLNKMLETSLQQCHGQFLSHDWQKAQFPNSCNKESSKFYL